LSTWFKLSELNFRFIGFMLCRNEITIYSVFGGLKSTIYIFISHNQFYKGTEITTI
jgi:hypothetical protein